MALPVIPQRKLMACEFSIKWTLAAPGRFFTTGRLTIRLSIPFSPRAHQRLIICLGRLKSFPRASMFLFRTVAAAAALPAALRHLAVRFVFRLEFLLRLRGRLVQGQ